MNSSQTVATSGAFSFSHAVIHLSSAAQSSIVWHPVRGGCFLVFKYLYFLILFEFSITQSDLWPLVQQSFQLCATTSLLLNGKKRASNGLSF